MHGVTLETISKLYRPKFRKFYVDMSALCQHYLQMYQRNIQSMHSALLWRSKELHFSVV